MAIAELRQPNGTVIYVNAAYVVKFVQGAIPNESILTMSDGTTYTIAELPYKVMAILNGAGSSAAGSHSGVGSGVFRS